MIKSYEQLTKEEVSLLEKLSAVFESIWESGREPAIEDHLPSEEKLRHVALIELVHADLEYRIKDGQSARVEQYLQLYPELDKESETLVGLVLAEYSQRKRRNEDVPCEEYLIRFPELSEEITGSWEAEKSERVPPADQHPIKELDSEGAEDETRLIAVDRTNAGYGKRVGGISEPMAGQKSDSTDLQVGDRFGRYLISELVGEGAMGRVYRATDERIGREIALKIPQLTDKEMVDRFLREGRSAARVRHPNICPIYDVDVVDGRHFFTMAFIEGSSLAELSKAERLGIDDAVRIVRKLAQVLVVLHQEGIVHRDIKPANVMLDDDREPLLTDFGLARSIFATDGESENSPDLVQLTQSGSLVGTPAYMSPEQIDGISPNERTDVYSLGVVLYELLTGDVPFKGTLGSVIADIARTAPKPPTGLNSEVSRALEDVCLKAMAKSPGDRYQTAAELAAALTNIDTHPVRSPVSPVDRMSRKVIALVASIALLFTAGIAFSKSGRGTLVVDAKGQNITVRVDEKVYTVKGKKLEIPLTVGKHQIVIEGAKKNKRNKQVIIRWRGSRAVITVNVEGKKNSDGVAVTRKGAGIRDDFDDRKENQVPGEPWQVLALKPGVTVAVTKHIHFGATGKSLHFSDESAGGGATLVGEFMKTKTVSVDYYMRSDSPDREGIFVMLYGDNGSDYAVGFGNETGGSGSNNWIGIFGGNGGWIVPEFLKYESSRWYHVRRTLDAEADLGEFYVAEVDPETGRDIPERSARYMIRSNYKNKYIDSVQVWSSGSQLAHAYIDNLVISPDASAKIPRLSKTDHRDNFDKQELGSVPAAPWKVISMQPGVKVGVTEKVHFGDKGRSLHFQDDAGDGQATLGRQLGRMTSVTLDYYMRSDATDREGVFVMLLGNNGSDHCVAFGNATGGSRRNKWIGIFGGKNAWIVPEFLEYTPGRWYHVRRTLDVKADRGEFYVAEVDPETWLDIPERSAQHRIGSDYRNQYIDRVEIWSSGGQLATGYIDNFVVLPRLPKDAANTKKKRD